jgi:hypothetical protein
MASPIWLYRALQSLGDFYFVLLLIFVRIIANQPNQNFREWGKEFLLKKFPGNA